MINLKLKLKKRELIKINRAKLFPKVILVLVMSLFLVSIIAVSTHAKPAELNRFLMIDIMAKGDDMDITGAITSIKGRIESDKDDGVPLGRVEFHTKIYDDSGEKVYSMKGKLKNGMVIPDYEFECTVRGVTWINLWLVVGPGMIKTTDVVIENFEYRGQLITLPNTGGKYVPAYIIMMVSPKGEYKVWVEEFDEDGVLVGGFWEYGVLEGWVFAGIMVGGIPSVGGVTFLTKYMEKWVP